MCIFHVLSVDSDICLTVSECRERNKFENCLRGLGLSDK
jgi:hypothetical protein